MSKSARSKILIQMTGSIACFKACALISKLVQAGHEVRVAASPSALKFVGTATLEGLTGKKVVSDLWEPGEAMSHIHLMRWADLVAVVPASANFINRAALGIGDDLLTTMFLAHDFKKPYLVAPAMNTSMYLHPATQASIRRLREMGVGILEAASGVLACGEVGYGRLLEPELLQREIETSLRRTVPAVAGTLPAQNDPGESAEGRSFRARKVLITSGGTREKIDDVRVLTNLSTGATGAELTDRMESLGIPTVLLHAESSCLPQADGERIPFTSSEDLRARMRDRLARGDVFAVVHLAAVSDFIPREWEQAGEKHPISAAGKISSSSELTLRLSRNAKILPEIRAMSPAPLHITAFKLTSGADESQALEAVNRVFESGADWVVHNDSTRIDRVSGRHPMTLHRNPREREALQGRAELAERLMDLYSRMNLKGEPHAAGS